MTSVDCSCTNTVYIVYEVLGQIMEYGGAPRSDIVQIPGVIAMGSKLCMRILKCLLIAISNSTLLMKWLKHFAKIAGCTKEHPPSISSERTRVTKR